MRVGRMLRCIALVERKFYWDSLVPKIAILWNIILRGCFPTATSLTFSNLGATINYFQHRHLVIINLYFICSWKYQRFKSGAIWRHLSVIVSRIFIGCSIIVACVQQKRDFNHRMLLCTFLELSSKMASEVQHKIQMIFVDKRIYLIYIYQND